jgi:hypothetical protein
MYQNENMSTKEPVPWIVRIKVLSCVDKDGPIIPSGDDITVDELESNSEGFIRNIIKV